MDIIEISPSRLQGIVRLSGAKNSILKLLTASILSSDKIQMTNYPSTLLDAQIHLEMLKCLGKTCEVENNQVIISEKGPIQNTLIWNKRSIRNTLLILGALVTRTGYGKVPLPGGCKLGDRKYDLHVMLLEKLGARVWEENEYLCAESKGRLQGADILLPMRSTGATENSIICGCLAQGTTRVWNPHIRPEIIDLIEFLRSMGAIIEVYGQESIRIDGVESLGGTSHRVIPDNMEALTWFIASVVSDGDIEIVDFPYKHLEIPLIHLRESGARFYRHDNSLIVRGGTCYPVEISTGPYPGINSDMQPLFAVLGACANGQSKIVDLRFANRYGYAEELRKMGLRSEVIDNALVINGGSKLRGTTVQALDLRAGAALAIAALVAEGNTTIDHAWQIERGYDRFFEKFSSLGGKIRVIE